MSSAEFSADGARLVTASSDRTAQLWDARTGRRLAEPLGMNAPLKTAAFSAEGGRVLTAGGRSLRLWGTPWLAAQPLRLGTGLFTKTAGFSPDGRRVLLARADGTARLYDRRTGEPVGQPMVHRGLLVAAQFSPDGRWVLTASQDGTARLWHGATGEPATPPLAHEGQPGDAAFSPDGRLIVTVTEAGSVRIWNAPTGQPLTPVLKHAEAVNVARFSPDSRWLVTGSSDGFVRIWDAHRGDAIGRPLAHDRLVHDAGFSPDGSRLVTTSADGTARLWNTATWEPAGAPLVLGRPVVAARFLPGGRRLVTADADGRLGVWDVDEGRLLVEIRGMDSAGLFQVRTDGAFLAAATTDGPIQLLEAAALQPATSAFSSDRMPHALGFSPDGRHLLSASSGAFLWDVPLGKSLCPTWLGLLAELVGGRVLQPQHVLADSSLDPVRTIAQIERQLQQESADDDWAVWARWFLAPARDRAISPHSALTLSNDVRRLSSPDASSIRAQRLALTAGDPELLASLPPEADLRAAPDAVASRSAPPGPQIYDGRLRHGWEDYSWCQVEFGGADTSPASPTGPRPMVVKVAPWQALYLHHAPFNPEGFDRLSFWIHGGEAEKSLIVRATIRGTAQPLIPISPPAHVWTHVVLPLKALHAAGDAGFDGFWIQEAQGKNQSAFYVDRVELLPPGDAGDRPEPPAPPR